MAAQYPTSAADDSDLYIAVNQKSTTLTDNPLAAGAVTVNVNDASTFPSVGAITIDAEIIHYTGKTATSFTGCTRGFDNTSDVSHILNTPVYHRIIADHHNVVKDEIKAIETDLVALQSALNDADTPASTATDVKDRLDQVVSQIKLITGETNWYDTPDTTIALLNTLKTEVESCESALNDADTPASTATDIKDRLDQIVSQLKLITGETNWYDAPDNTIAALETDKAEDSAVVHDTGDESISGVKDFTGQLKGKGTSTNDSASAEYIGEYVESVVSAVNFPATTVWGDATSISLTAGDWDVEVSNYYTKGSATVTSWRSGISITAGNSTTGMVVGVNHLIRSTAIPDSDSLPVPSYRISLSSTTTVYAKFRADYSVATPSCNVIIRARRVR